MKDLKGLLQTSLLLIFFISIYIFTIFENDKRIESINNAFNTYNHQKVLSFEKQCSENYYYLIDFFNKNKCSIKYELNDYNYYAKYNSDVYDINNNSKLILINDITHKNPFLEAMGLENNDFFSYTKTKLNILCLVEENSHVCFESFKYYKK